MTMFIRLIAYVSLTMMTHCYHPTQEQPLQFKPLLDKDGKPSSATRNFYDEDRQDQKRVNRTVMTNNSDSHNEVSNTQSNCEFEKTKEFEEKYKQKLWHKK